MKTLSQLPLAFALIATCASGAALAAEPAAPTPAPQMQQLETRIDTLSQQLEALKAELKQVQEQNKALAVQQQKTEQQVAAQPAQAQTSPSALSGVNLWGYGEVYYARPVRDTAATTADLGRAVFGIGYSFDDRTQLNSEFEVEHAVSSSSDPGEMEVEQFYINRQITDNISGKAGLFLIPAGLLNLSHEPTHYYGVQRNFVETLIIPSTWREGGLSLHGDSDIGIGWDIGLTTGLDLSKWDINPSAPLYTNALEFGEAAPMQATHQELALAKAQNLSQFVAVSYKGIPGFDAGASVFTGNTVKYQPTLPDNQRVTLWEVHSRWTPGQADLSALYARGTISNTAQANRLFPGASNPIPAAFYGYYLQGAYNVWKHDGYRLAPFVRWERFNLGSSYQGIPMGFTASAQPTEQVWTYGANFYLNPHVVFKADYQSFLQNRNFDRLDLGVGVNF